MRIKYRGLYLKTIMLLTLVGIAIGVGCSVQKEIAKDTERASFYFIQMSDPQFGF